MKRVIATLAGFFLPAAAAVYVALAPFDRSGSSTGPLGLLDGAAGWISALAGRSNAVLGLLGLAVALSMLALYFTGRPAADAADENDMPDDGFQRDAWGEAQGAPAPWTPESVTPEARVANLRRRSLGGGRAVPEAEPAFEMPAEPVPAPADAPFAPPPPAVEAETFAPVPAPAAPGPQAGATPPPVVLVRKPRLPGHDWFDDGSWLGGLPRLADTPWPRGAAGEPLPFAAQVDLADIAAAFPGADLPREGSLAFFLGTGAVVAVPAGPWDFAAPPEDLPPAYDEGGLPFPPAPNRFSRWFFPFWPVDPVALDLPGQPPVDEDAVTAQAARHAGGRDHPFYAAGVGEPVERLWWHAIIHLADGLHEALDASARPLALRRDALASRRAALLRLEADAGTDPEAIEDARDAVAMVVAELEELEDQRAALPAMAEALDQFVADRDPWAALEADELAIAGEILAEVHEGYGELVRYHVPGTLADLATISLRAMVSGPPDVFAAMPQDVLARINRDYRLTPVERQHRMFGPGDAPGEVLLLQLAYDDMMEWCWGETGAWRFTIPEEDAAAGNWSAARLSFVQE